MPRTAAQARGSRESGTASGREDDRYSRQCVLPEIGPSGQARLGASRAVVVGCGALGTVQASLLVRAGVGETVLVDRDYVEVGNLQRQLLFDERDAHHGTPKAEAAAKHLRLANSEVSVVPVVADLTARNAERHLGGASVILDGTDNFETRYLLNDAAVKLAIPWIYGAAVGTHGSVMAIVPGSTACLACLFPSAPTSPQPTCDTAGVLNAVTALVASLQVVEALKVLTGQLDSVTGRLVTLDPWRGQRSSVATASPDPQCPTCQRRQFRALAAVSDPAAKLCGRDAVQVRGRRRRISLGILADGLERIGEVRRSELALRFLCPPHELTVFADGRAIVKGTRDPALARSLYSRFVGD